MNNMYVSNYHLNYIITNIFGNNIIGENFSLRPEEAGL